MPNEYLLSLSFLAAGGFLTLAGVIIGAFLMFRGSKTAPGVGEGFLKSPKGDVFNVVDDVYPSPVDEATKPNKDEEHVLKRTDRFLKALVGGAK